VTKTSWKKKFSITSHSQQAPRTNWSGSHQTNSKGTFRTMASLLNWGAYRRNKVYKIYLTQFAYIMIIQVYTILFCGYGSNKILQLLCGLQLAPRKIKKQIKHIQNFNNRFCFNRLKYFLI
jgi:hypothetical protein